MSGVTASGGGITSINRLRSTIKALPLRIRSAVAKDAAPILTDMVQEAYDSGQTVYDAPRPLSTAGQSLTLLKTGATRRDIGFTAVGTIVRAVLGRKYQRYLVGKYSVLPSGRIPAKWSERLSDLVREYAEDLQREGLQ